MSASELVYNINWFRSGLTVPSIVVQAQQLGVNRSSPTTRPTNSPNRIVTSTCRGVGKSGLLTAPNSANFPRLSSFEKITLVRQQPARNIFGRLHLKQTGIAL